MTTLLWCFHLFWIPTRSSVCFLFVSSLCKEKSPRLLRNEVSDTVPEYSGPFFFCCLNKLIFVFPNPPVEFYWWLLPFQKLLSLVVSGVQSYIWKCVSLLLPLGLGVWTTWSWRTHAHYQPINTPLPLWRITAGRHDTGGEKHVLLRPVEVLHIVYGGSLCCCCAVTERVCHHPSQQQQMELTGQLTSCFGSLGGCLASRWSRHRQVLIHTEITGRDWTRSPAARTHTHTHTHTHTAVC